MKLHTKGGSLMMTAGGITLALLVLAGLVSACKSAQAKDAGGEKVVYQQGFEDTLDSWRGRGGGESITLAQGKAHSGNSSVFIKGRSKTWNGLIRRFVNLKPGKSYRISAWFMYEDGLPTQGINISVQQETEGQGETYNTVGADRLPKGDWTYIEGEYTVPKSRYEMALSIYFESTWKSDESVTPEDLFDFYIDDISIVELPPAPPPLVEKDIPTLSDILPEIPLGAAIDYANLNPQDIHHGMLRHFNAYVYGNEMKQDALEPSEGHFVWSKADELIDYAEANGKKVRGHVLVWHEQVPAWLFQGSGPNGLATKEELYRRMERHIKEVVTRYKGRVYAWDVVNEVIGDDGKFRNSKYYQIVGSHEYIANAFR
jgi:endo-1,4-beta-xylanase